MGSWDEVKRRWKSPTPPFFRKLRKIGLLMAGIGGAFLASPVPLSEFLHQMAGYLVTAGSVISCVSQVTIEENN